MKNRIIKFLKIIGLYKTYEVPKRVTQNYTELDPVKLSLLNTIISDYCKPENYSSNEKRLIDIEVLLTVRLINFRKFHIPFLFETIGLKNKQILEIGCGTGSSTVALSEQGAVVTGIDIDEHALSIARKRLELHGLNPSLQNINAVNIKEEYGNREWDMVIFFASLEHMTPGERKKSLKDAYALLKNGGHLCIFGSPNRLWPYDSHTSELPFYLWLQDEIALDYSLFSPRPEFAKMNKNNINTAYNELYRWARGVSFHEIEVGINKEASKLKVVGSLPIFLRRYSVVQWISYRRSSEYKYKKLLSEYGPKNIHPGFYECYIDVIIEKD